MLKFISIQDLEGIVFGADGAVESSAAARVAKATRKRKKGKGKASKKSSREKFNLVSIYLPY